MPKPPVELKKSAKATKDPLTLILSRALGDDGGALRGAHRFQLWAKTQPELKEQVEGEIEKLSEGRNGYRSHFWAVEFAKQPADVQAQYNTMAVEAVASAKVTRDELYKKTEDALEPAEAQECVFQNLSHRLEG